MQRNFMLPPRQNMMMGGYGGYEHYMRAVGGDMRYWPRDAMGYESTAAAATDSVTGR
jgi:hypothetical protein